MFIEHRTLPTHTDWWINGREKNAHKNHLNLIVTDDFLEIDHFHGFLPAHRKVNHTIPMVNVNFGILKRPHTRNSKQWLNSYCYTYRFPFPSPPIGLFPRNACRTYLKQLFICRRDFYSSTMYSIVVIVNIYFECDRLCHASRYFFFIPFSREFLLNA